MEQRRNIYYADWPRFFSDHGVPATDGIRLYNEFMRSGERPSAIPGAPEAIRNYKRPMIVFSSHPQAELDDDVKRYGLEGCFVHVAGSVNKANPEILRDLLRRLEGTPERTLYGGDTTVDLTLAHQNLMQSVAVVSAFGYQTREHIEACPHPPTHGIVEHVRDVFRIAST